MSDRFWYILAGAVFVVVNIILWIHQRRCKAKGIKPYPPSDRFKKHEKRISRWLDGFIVSYIVVFAVLYGSMLSIINRPILPEIPSEYTQRETHLLITVDLLLLFIYFDSAVLMASLLSPFHKNITITKRIILFIMCCVPLVIGILFWIYDDRHNHTYYIKLLLGGLFPVLFINWPPILLGKPFIEVFPRLIRKIPLPYFQIPDSEQRDANQLK